MRRVRDTMEMESAKALASNFSRAPEVRAVRVEPDTPTTRSLLAGLAMPEEKASTKRSVSPKEPDTLPRE